MQPLQFVNHRGEAIDPALRSSPAKKAASSKSSGAYHKGWRVVGYSQEQILLAKRAHAELYNSGDNPFGGRQFDLDAYMLTHKPVAVRSKPYEVHSAALECAELAARSGWIGVQVVAKAKGGRDA